MTAVSSGVITLLINKMNDLTERQTKILKAIVEEYMDQGKPVGSESLEKKFELGVSPATVRNEMVRLTDLGFLKQVHASAGRTPTKEAFRFYVSRLMEEKNLSVTDEVVAKEKVWDYRFDFEKLIKQATKALAERTKMLAIAATDSGDVYHAGYAYILEMPEFYDIDVTRAVLTMLEETERLCALLNRAFGDGPIHLILGDELGYKLLEPCGTVFTSFSVAGHHGSLGVIGPNRLNYPAVVPMVRYFGKLIEELAANH